MLFWTKLLTIAHATTISVHPFLILYYIYHLHLDVFIIYLLSSCIILLKMPAAMVWIHIIDRHPSLHGVLTGLLTAIGAIGILIVLSIPPTWTPFILPAAIISCILDGSFFQPLEVVIDSAIIKILAKERNWGKFTLAIVTFAIGCFLEGDHDFDTLMVVLLIGSVALFLLSLSTSVQAVDPALLVGRQHQPLLTTEIIYKPYHVFGEHLSHISEEDASMLQRMATTHSKYTSIIDQYASFDLVRLPHPPASSASIVLMSSLKISCSHEEDAQEKRVARSMQISFLCLGIVRGMTQSVIYLFLYDKLKMPTYIIGAVGSMEIFSSLLADRLLIHVIEHVTHLWIATCSAYTLSLLSTVVYIYLTMNTILIQVSVIILQLCQGLSFHMIWLLAINHVNSSLLTEDKRMMLKGYLSTVYSHVGYALGVIATGYLISSNHDYTLIYKYSLLFILSSAFLAWEWTFTV